MRCYNILVRNIKHKVSDKKMLNTISLKHTTTKLLNILTNEVVFSLSLTLAIITYFLPYQK